MARTKKGTPPSYPTRPHKGQARITVRTPSGGRKDLYLGPFGSAESRQEYQRILAELEAAGGYFVPRQDGRPTSDLTVSELLLLFWTHAEQYYRLADGSPSRELDHYKLSLEPVLRLYGDTLAREFGPLALKAVRQRMMDAREYRVRAADKPGAKARWVGEGKVELEKGQALLDKNQVRVEVLGSRQALCRRVINQRVDHVRRVFRWAVSEQLVASDLYQALTTVAGLRRGQQGTRENPKVKPVADEVVEATLPFLRPQVRAMVQVQRLTGARPTEVCLMRGRDIDRTGPVWWYKIDPNEVAREDGPGQAANLHKTAHHENPDGSATVKLLPIGPKAQAILEPFLEGRDPDAHLFSPAEARHGLNAEKKANRRTPRWPSHVKAQAARRRAQPKRAPRDHYDRHSYAHAVARAARRADAAAHQEDPSVPAGRVVVPHWHPHQLKHSVATEVRRLHGAEAARVYVGHANLSTTEIYAEKDLKQIERIALEVG
jgi:integrase